MSNRSTLAALRAATNAVMKLSAQGVTVRRVEFAAVPNAKRQKPTLVVASKPAFSRFGLKATRPGQFVVEHVYAAPYFGVQLEYIEHIPVARSIGHG